MPPEEARAHYNFLITLYIRKAESFGPLAFTFIKDRSFVEAGLMPDEQFNLLMATTDAFADEPKRYGHKFDCLQKAVDLLPKTHCYDATLARQLRQEIPECSPLRHHEHLGRSENNQVALTIRG